MQEVLDDKVQFETYENGTVCFVNTMDTPHKVVKLPLYRYSEGFNGLEFSQLCRYTYLLTKQGASCAYTVEVWEPFGVPTYKQSLFKLVIDSMKALSDT